MVRSAFIFEGRVTEIVLQTPEPNPSTTYTVTWKRGSHSGHVACSGVSGSVIRMPMRQDMKFETNLERDKTSRAQGWKPKLLTLSVTKGKNKEIGKTTIQLQNFMNNGSTASVSGYQHHCHLQGERATLKIDCIMYPSGVKPAGLSLRSLAQQQQAAALPASYQSSSASLADSSTADNSKDAEIARLRQQLSEAETNFTLRLSEMQSQAPPAPSQQTFSSSDPETQKLVEDLQMHSLTLEQSKAAVTQRNNELEELVFTLRSELTSCKNRIAELENQLDLQRNEFQNLTATAAALVPQQKSWSVDFAASGTADSASGTPWEKGFSDKEFSFNRQGSTVSSMSRESPARGTREETEQAVGERAMFQQNDKLFAATVAGNQSLFPEGGNNPPGGAQADSLFPAPGASFPPAAASDSLFPEPQQSLFSSPPAVSSPTGFPPMDSTNAQPDAAQLFPSVDSPQNDQQPSLFDSQKPISASPPNGQPETESGSLFPSVGVSPAAFTSPEAFQSGSPQKVPSDGNSSPQSPFSQQQQQQQQPPLFGNDVVDINQNSEHVWSPKSVDSEQAAVPGLEQAASPVPEVSQEAASPSSSSSPSPSRSESQPSPISSSPQPVASPQAGAEGQIGGSLFTDPVVVPSQSTDINNSPTSSNISATELWDSSIGSTLDGKWLLCCCDNNLPLIENDDIILSVVEVTFENNDSPSLDLGMVGGTLVLKLTAKKTIEGIMARAMQVQHKEIGIGQAERELIDIGDAQETLMEYLNTRNFPARLEEGEEAESEFKLRIKNASVKRLRYDLRYQMSEDFVSAFFPIHPLRWASSQCELPNAIVTDTIRFEEFSLKQEVTLPLVAVSVPTDVATKTPSTSFVHILHRLNFAATAFPDGKIYAATSFGPDQYLIARINASSPEVITIEVAGSTENLCKAVRHTILCFLLP